MLKNNIFKKKINKNEEKYIRVVFRLIKKKEG